MMKLTASNLVAAIKRLPNEVWFDYVNEKTTTKVQYVRAQGPEGPIVILRRKGGGITQEITTQQQKGIRNDNSNSRSISKAARHLR